MGIRDGRRLGRELFVSGAFRDYLISIGADPSVLLTEEQIVASLETTLAGRGGEVWLFGYGSLIWNPALHVTARHIALTHGWHRRYCIWLPNARGTPTHPALMLGLDRGGCCRGVALKLPDESELLPLWRREMAFGFYVPRWIRVQTQAGPLDAIAFTANRRHSFYAGRLSVDQIAQAIARAKGPLGSCSAYLEETVQHLQQLGIPDPTLERLHRRVAR